MDQQQQQQQQRVNSFYRANRPGNLNISDIDEVTGLIQQQQQTVIDISTGINNNNNSSTSATFVNHQPVIMNQSSSNGVYPQQSPHYQASQMAIKSQQQQQQQLAVSSPSYLHQPGQQMTLGSPAPHHLSHHHASISAQSQQQQQQVLYSPQPYMNSSQQSQQYAGVNNKNGLMNNSTSSASTSYDQQQMSYTPKYSPSCIATASSAHIVNKHAQYFNFDVNNVYTDNNLNKPGLAASNLASSSHQTAQLHTGMSTNVVGTSSVANTSASAHLISPRYITAQPPSLPPPGPIPQSPGGQQPQQQQPQHAYMFTNYQNMPHTPLSPASALPFNTNTGHVTAHLNSHSVPNSPLMPAKTVNTHSTTVVQPHSVFQFSANHIQQSIATNNVASSSNNTNTRFCPPMSAPILTSSGGMVMSNTSATTSTQLLSHSYEFQPDNGLIKPQDSVPGGDNLANNDTTNEDTENRAANLVTSNTFTEHDVDMVDEVLNDMLQKEEEIINSQNQNSSVVSPSTVEPSTQSLLADDENLIGSADIDPISSQEEKTSVNIVAAATSTSTTTTTTKPNNNKSHNVVSSYSLSNLSEAASVEFELNYANLSTNNRKKNIESTTTASDVNDKTNDEQNDIDDEEDDEDESIDENNIIDDAATIGSGNMYNNENNSNGAFSLDMIKSNKSGSLIREVLKNPKKSKASKLKHEMLSSYENSMEGFLGSPSSSNQSMLNGHLASMMSSSSPGNGQQVCPICSKLFTNKSALAKHRLTHSNERKYTCHVCDKAFKRQDHLNGHMLTHQDKKPFSCKAPGCDKSYCDSRSLKRHVESQHQDYLALLACGNQEALNYLPNIGKIKANIGPNIQQEILVTNEGSIPLNPSIESTGDGSNAPDSIRPSNSRPKNFFTFEEPKPEKCKICGKGFKNIPALNGHMRLHGGTVKDKTGSTESKGESSFSQHNEDSLSNCSNNSSSYQPPTVKQQSFSQLGGKDFEYNSKQFKPKPRNAQSLDVPGNGAMKYFKKESSRDGYTLAHSPAMSSESKLPNSFNNNINGGGQISSNHMQHSVNEIISSIYPTDYNKKIKQSYSNISQNGADHQYGLQHDQYGYENRHLNPQFKLPQAPSQLTNTSSSSSGQLNGSLTYHKTHHTPSNHVNSSSIDANYNSPYHSNLDQYMPSPSNNHHHHNAYEDTPGHSVRKHESYYETESDYHHHHHHQNQIARPRPKYGNSLDSSSSYQNERASSNEIRRCSPQPPPSHQSHLEHTRQSEAKDHQSESSSTSNNMDLKHIYDITFNAAKMIFPAVPLEQVSMQAAAATAVAVASVTNQQKQTQAAAATASSTSNNFATSSASSSSAVSPSTSSGNKSKIKPVPLHIPSDINAFQNKQNALLEAAAASSRSQLNPPPAFNHSTSYSGLSNTNPHYYAGYYPNATLLKSPRLFPSYHDIMYNKKQYTPPPMLSPFRKGPGLFYNPRFMSLFLPFMAAAAANANNNQESNNHAAPNLNHSVSYPSNYRLDVYDENNNEHYYEPDEEDEPRMAKKPRTSRMDDDNVEETNNKEEKKQFQSQISESGGVGSNKPSLIRSRLMSQISTCSITSGAFFPDDSANETIAAAIADCAEIPTTAFINVGEDYQAVLPDLKSEKTRMDLDSTNREDLMISPERLTRCHSFTSTQFTNYLELVCNSSLVYGSSNNLELGLHVLNYFDGDVEKAVKGFLNVSIELPVEHPIRTYKYNETECWSTDEIKKFESAIIKNDKMFSEIASEVGTKSVKQCVEFYYLWKKVMSEGVRKKWRHVKRTRMNGYDETATSDETNKDETSGEKAPRNASKNDEEENDDDDDSEQVASRVGGDRVESEATSKNRVGLEFKCQKCNKSFKTKRKLKTHLNSHTTTN